MSEDISYCVFNLVSHAKVRNILQRTKHGDLNIHLSSHQTILQCNDAQNENADKSLGLYVMPPIFLPLHSPVPKDRDKFYFKLRQSVQKKVVVSVQQICNKELGIER